MVFTDNQGVNSSLTVLIHPFATLTVAPSGDFDGDGHIGDSDFVRWSAGFGTSGSANRSEGDADDDKDVDGADFLVWQQQWNSATPADLAAERLPEPMTLAMLLIGTLPVLGRSTRGA